MPTDWFVGQETPLHPLAPAHTPAARPGPPGGRLFPAAEGLAGPRGLPEPGSACLPRQNPAHPPATQPPLQRNAVWVFGFFFFFCGFCLFCFNLRAVIFRRPRPQRRQEPDGALSEGAVGRWLGGFVEWYEDPRRNQIHFDKAFISERERKNKKKSNVAFCKTHFKKAKQKKARELPFFGSLIS